MDRFEDELGELIEKHRRIGVASLDEIFEGLAMWSGVIAERQDEEARRAELSGSSPSAATK